MNFTKNDLDIYLSKIKEAISNNRYRIEKNSKRQDNINLFIDYVLDEKMVKKILLELTTLDFSEVLQNKNIGFEHEKLYVFGKEVELLERFGNTKKTVSLYIKINMLESCFVIVVSFHKQKYPMKYYFK